MTVWIAVIAVGLGTIALKGVGPVLLSGPLPARLDALAVLLGPALLAALVVTQTVGDSDGFVADARLAGVGAAVVAVALRAPLLVVVALAATTTALVRAFA